MENQQGENNDKKKKLLLLLLLLLIFIVIVVFIVVLLIIKMNNDKDNNSEKNYENSQEVIEDFFNTDSMIIDAHMEKISYETGEPVESQVTIWKTNSYIRMDYEMDTEWARSLIVNEDQAYFYYYERESIDPAVVPPEYYFDMFVVKDKSNALLTGTDEEFSGEIYNVSIDKVHNVPGAPNMYYVKEYNYCVGEQGIFYVESVGAPSDVGEIPEEVNYSRIVFDNYELDADIPVETFDEPF